MEIEHIKITDLKPEEYNPRRISEEDYRKLKNSISTFGLVDPIIVIFEEYAHCGRTSKIRCPVRPEYGG